MEYINSIIFGAIQSLTEFLPISSSGHLIIFHEVIKSELLNSITFDVILHGGTLLAVIIYFWQDVVKLVKGFFNSIFRRNLVSDSYQRLSWLIIIGTVPAASVGYYFNDLIENYFRNISWVIIMLVVGAILFILAEKFSKKIRSIETMTVADSVLIGLAQVLAFIPGMSRSGITIVAAMYKNFDRVTSARFSFLLSIPIILGANIRKVTQFSLSDFSWAFIFVFILGAASAALIGYFVIKYLLKFLTNHSLIPFAIYRIILAIALYFFYIF